MNTENRVRLSFNRGTDDRRLAGARLAKDQGDSLAAGNTVFDIADRLAMWLGEGQVPRMWREVERAFTKPKEAFVHCRVNRGK